MVVVTWRGLLLMLLLLSMKVRGRSLLGGYLYPPLPLQFPAQGWPLSDGKFFLKSNILLQVAPPLPRPGFFPGCWAAGGLGEGGRGGLYGNPEKRMPSFLICI